MIECPSNTLLIQKPLVIKITMYIDCQSMIFFYLDRQIEYFYFRFLKPKSCSLIRKARQLLSFYLVVTIE